MRTKKSVDDLSLNDKRGEVIFRNRIDSYTCDPVGLKKHRFHQDRPLCVS